VLKCDGCRVLLSFLAFPSLSLFPTVSNLGALDVVSRSPRKGRIATTTAAVLVASRFPCDVSDAYRSGRGLLPGTQLRLLIIRTKDTENLSEQQMVAALDGSPVVLTAANIHLVVAGGGRVQLHPQSVELVVEAQEISAPAPAIGKRF
jgi:hypothetical protein